MPVRWQQGEHVAIIGQTGSGKTYLETKLVALREYVVVLKTKADDTKFPPPFVTRRKATALDDLHNQKIVLAPSYYHQSYEGWWMLEKAWHHEAWTIVIDELVRAEDLGLGDQIKRGLTQGRSIKLTMMCGMQRPSRVMRYALSEPRHVFAFSLEGRDADILGEMTSDTMEQAVRSLDYASHQFAYFNRSTRQVQIGDANSLGEIFFTKAVDNDADPDNARKHNHGIFRRLALPRG